MASSCTTLEGKHIKKVCDRLLKDRNEMTLNQAQIIRDLGYDISVEEVKQQTKTSKDSKTNRHK